MSWPDLHFSPSEAAKRLGVSPKALRLYEQRGLLSPLRTQAGWRTYGPADMARAQEIVRLRALGLSLADVARALQGEGSDLAALLAAHQSKLEAKARQLGTMIQQTRALQAGTRSVQLGAGAETTVDLKLPWPWDGENFTLPALRPLTYITGPLGCGKTRLAVALAERMSGAQFLGLNRMDAANRPKEIQSATKPQLRARFERTMTELEAANATCSPALDALIMAYESSRSTPLVIDMVEEGLDGPTQEAVAALFRRRALRARPVITTTRSILILDLDRVGAQETVIHCPANHSPPTVVAPYPGAEGREAVRSCLAAPHVRARTAGVFACNRAPAN